MMADDQALRMGPFGHLAGLIGHAPFLNGLFSSGFSRGKTAPQDEIGETPH